MTNITYLFIFTFCINCCVCKKYYNYTLFRGVPVKNDHLQYLMNLTKFSDVNFWRDPGLLYKPVDFVIGPESKPVFLAEAGNLGLYFTTIIEDVQKAFDEQTVKPYIRRKMESFDWKDYFQLDDIYQWLRDLAKANPKEMELMNIGKTYEGRDILAVKIVLKGCKMRSKVIIEGGIHAREWITPAFVTYFINQVISSQKSKDEALKKTALTYEWYFVPVLNPDGYEYSQIHVRLWRKNRSNGYGVDLNRNFDSAFGTIGVSGKWKSEIYCGPNAFSENESKAMKKFVESKSINLEYYFAFHSYGQYMIIPYYNSKLHSDNFYEVERICKDANKKIATKYKTQYTIGTAYDTVGYTTSGDSPSWVKKSFRVPYVLTIELRDTGYYGFALPPSDILPTCRETMDGMISLLTPKTRVYKKLKELRNAYDSAGPEFILDKIVIVFNLLLFIIVRSD